MKRGFMGRLWRRKAVRRTAKVAALGAAAAGAGALVASARRRTGDNSRTGKYLDRPTVEGSGYTV